MFEYEFIYMNSYMNSYSHIWIHAQMYEFNNADFGFGAAAVPSHRVSEAAANH